MYLESRDMDDMKNVYMTAWRKGLKTTYYLHMKPRHTAEQSTTVVNKQEMTGKRGFAAIKTAAATAPANATPSPIKIETASPAFAEVAREPVASAAITQQQSASAQVAVAEPIVVTVAATIETPASAPVSASQRPNTVEGPEDPGAANICIACE